MKPVQLFSALRPRKQKRHLMVPSGYGGTGYLGSAYGAFSRWRQ